MDSPSASPRPYEGSAAVSTPGSNDESQRVKFLCSFSGSIIPRPQDGKLRYVGGETRIVSVPRDIKYEDLMSRMKELFEEANLLKYQQPDEDLDALVSVVNDDDVTNMMEEYDKLGSGDGFIRLRIFLFSHPDQDVPLHFIESDERDSERRYVDALNNMNDPSDFRNQQWNDSPRMSFVDDMYAGDQYFSAGPEGSVHNQRNWDNIMPSYNLQHAQYGSGQLQQIPGHRYGDMEPPWNPAPAFYSPRHHGHFDPRTSEFPHSPSSARYRMPVEFSDGRFSEDYVRPAQVIQHPQQNPHPTMMERQPQQPHNAPSGHMAGFPGNVLHDTNQVEGNSICGQCRMTYKRNPPDVEYSHMGNGLQQAFDPCNVCHPNTESGWTPRNQLNPRAEGPRGFLPSDGRLGDRYIVDGSGFTTPIGNYNLQDGPLAASNYSQFEEQRYVRPGYEFGAEPFVNKAAPLGPHIQSHVHEVPYGNPPLVYGTENSCQVQYGHVPSHGSWKNVQTPLRHGSELPASPLTNGVLSSGYHRNTKEGSPTMHIGTNNQNVVHASPEVGGLDASAMLEYPHGHALRLNTRHLKHRPDNPGAIQSMPDNPGAIQSMPDDPSIVQSIPDNFVYDVEPVDFLIPASALVSDQVVIADLGSRKENNYAPAVTVEENGSREAKGTLVVEHNGGIEQNNTGDENQAGMTVIESVGTHVSEPSNENADEEKVGEKDPTVLLETKLSVEQLSFLPELIASVKKAALEGAEEVKAKFQDHNSSAVLDDSPDKEKNPVEIGDTQADGDSDSDNVDTSKIEPTEAEAEAIARGLQTIKNDDLEEIRELGTGTYGAVFHGKWKGSDVAVKRIKASCFAGKQRERLIADFWKEALLLSSLHHPNIVTFYGIVRDGPDSTLATVTEFMTNGSLKQFLQKKDRTIDRRKRLIIAMDAAFGMEYLHGKNIVHFDLKCENLLVNMKDPQRPVCKIGDMGLSKVKQHTLVSGGVRGTLPWMAPELLSGKSNMVSENVDVYSFGIVLWELLTGDEPYKDMHCASIIGGIVNNTLRPQIPSWCDPEWKSLMESCWASNPVDRPSFSEISQKLRNMAAAMNVKAMSYKKLAVDLKPGNTILCADGTITLTVLSCDAAAGTVRCRCENTAVLGERKNVNLPGVVVDLPTLTEKDKEDILEWGVPNNIDMIALSFVRKGSDLVNVRKLLGPHAKTIQLMSKVENQEGVINFDEILRETDSFMVARGDLGMEIPVEKIFLAQKMMIYKCNLAGKPVVTATQMLESMIKSPRPTRAEATDVANAVLDGTDCVMLSGESAAGAYPEIAVKIMARICIEAESSLDYSAVFKQMIRSTPLPMSPLESLASSAVRTANKARAKLIVVLTRGGTTAKLVAKYRPAVPILSVVVPVLTTDSFDWTISDEAPARHSLVYRGLIPLLAEGSAKATDAESTEVILEASLKSAVVKGLCVPGDAVVVLHRIGAASVIKICVVKE